MYFTFAFWGYTSANCPIPRKTYDGKGGLQTYLSFRTLARPELSWMLGPLFILCRWLGPNKVVPANIKWPVSGRWPVPIPINGRVLAYWIMDDGSWTGSGVLIHSNSFSESDVMGPITS